jgi:hypothetical protein
VRDLTLHLRNLKIYRKRSDLDKSGRKVLHKSGKPQPAVIFGPESITVRKLSPYGQRHRVEITVLVSVDTGSDNTLKALITL